MKTLKQTFKALLGTLALIGTAVVGAGNLVWNTIRSCSKRIRRIIVTLVIMVLAAIITSGVIAFYKWNYGRTPWFDETMSRNVEIHTFRNNTIKIYNTATGKYTTPRIEWASGAYGDDSLAVYATSDKRGYFSAETGEIHIDADKNNYNKAWIFSEGVAAVVKEGKIGFINTDNEVVIPFQYDYSNNCMSKISPVFHQGFCVMGNAEGKVGLIDKSGKWVLPPAYDDIWSPQDNGYRVAINDGKYGILNTAGEIVYPFEYRYTHVLTDGFVLAKDGRMWQVDLNGRTVKPFLYEFSYNLRYPAGYNCDGNMVYEIADYATYEIRGLSGIIDRTTGKMITPAIYTRIEMLSYNVFEVEEYKCEGTYLIDEEGNAIN